MAGTTTTPPASGTGTGTGTPRAGTTPAAKTYGVTGASTPVTNNAQALLNLRSTKN